MVPAADAIVPAEELGTTMVQELPTEGLEPTGGYKFNVV